MSGRDDYIEVADRLQAFYDKYPDGSLQVARYEVKEIGGATWWIVEAHAYRTPDDPRPGIGLAQEVVPGRTNFTRGSELMNAETSAWGRAMAALGIATKRGIASAHEVRMAKARQQDEQMGQTKPVARQKATPDDPANAPYTSPPPRPAALDAEQQLPHTFDPLDPARPASRASVGKMFVTLKQAGITDPEHQKQAIARVFNVAPETIHTNEMSQRAVNAVITWYENGIPEV